MGAVNFTLHSPLGEKVAPQGRTRGELAAASRKHAITAGSPLISQRAGPLTASPAGEAILPGGFNVNAHFRHQKRLRVPPVGGGVPDAPRGGDESLPYTPRLWELVGRPALWPPRRGQDPSLQICHERGCSGKAAGRAYPAPTVQQKAAPILYRERRGLFVCSYTSLNSCPLNGARVSFNSPPQALPTSRFGFSVRPPKHCQSVSSSFVSLPARGRVSV